MIYVGLTQRAIDDIREIKTLSIEKWGNATADSYLQDIEDALRLLKENPGILREIPEASNSFHFYRVTRHFLVCAVYEYSIFVLTVKHGAIDIPMRITELEPQLKKETAALYKAYLEKRK